MSITWHSNPDPARTADAAARHIFTVLAEAIESRGRASLAISGGSTPKLLFQELAQRELDWSRLHLFWADERAVPPTDPESNYKLADEFLITPAQIPRGNVHRIEGELDPAAAAERYSAVIRKFFELNDDEPPQFDVIQLGMGPDGHTASLFPGEPLLDDRQGIAAPVFAEKKPNWRITLLPGPLLSARRTVFLVTGADKAPVVQAVFHGNYDPAKLPAQLISHQGYSVFWFLDDAASRLIPTAR